MERTYWRGARVGRRTMLRGSGLGLAGLAGAALVGCGSSDDDSTPEAGQQTGAQLTATAVATGTGDAGPVSADQVRVPAGIYQGPVGPSAAELNPAVNA